MTIGKRLVRYIDTHIGNPFIDMYAAVVTMNIVAVAAVMAGYLEATIARSITMVAIDVISILIWKKRFVIRALWDRLHPLDKYQLISLSSWIVTLVLLGAGYLLFG